MDNINLNILYFEQNLQNLISQSQLPVSVVELVLKDTLNKIGIQKQLYLNQLTQNEQDKEEDFNNEVE